MKEAYTLRTCWNCKNFISCLHAEKVHTEGFVEIIIRDDGTVQQTGKSYRIDGTDYYTPYVGEMPTMFEAVEIPCDYDELLKAARAMHTWIFLHSGNENLAYKACGLSDEMNAFLGYSGPYTVTIPAGKEEVVHEQL